MMTTTSVKHTNVKDWMAIWNDSLKKKVFRVLVLTHCGICDYLIHISEVEEVYRGFVIDFDPTCRICGNDKTFKVDSIRVKRACRE